MIKLHHGDCLDILPTIESGLVDCVIIDPPYFNVVNEKWDRQWKTRDDFINWLESVVLELKRILKSNGSLYIFADDKICAYVQVMIDKHLNLLNNIVWNKINNLPIKNAHLLRSYAPMTERILFYTPQLCKTGLQTIEGRTDLYENLREYCLQIRKYIKYSRQKMIDILGNGRSQHFLEPLGPQWQLCTIETYDDLIKHFSIDRYSGFREYESLRQEYESLRRVFNAGNGRFDVIQEKIITTKENSIHPTTKPTRLIKQFIEASTNKNDLVLDCFMGSGTTGVACKYLDRSFIGIEKEKEYFELSEKRINGAEPEPEKSEPQQMGF